MPFGVVVRRGPTGIQYSPPLQIDCSFAEQLGGIETIIQQEAEALLGAPIVRIRTLGSYVCRGKIGSPRGGKELSEHASGNAVDVAAFQTKKSWRWITVAKHYPLQGEDTPEAQFLARVQQRLRRESVLTRVIGPNFNAFHRDHFHLDRGRPWWLEARSQ